MHTSIVVDSNPALFAVMAAITAAGYDTTLAGSRDTGPAARLRQRLRVWIATHPAAVLPELREFYRTHRLADPNQNLAQYVTLALFLGNPPGLSLAVPAAGLPPGAAAVDGIVPLARSFYTQANLQDLWQAIQPQYEELLDRDAAAVRANLSVVDAFFRMTQNYSPRQFYIFPGALVSSAQADALNYEQNYYFITGLDLAPQMKQVRHTYLHFLFDSLIGSYPAIVTQVGQKILPLVERAPALPPEFKRNAQLFYSECLVHAAEIQLSSATPAVKQQQVESAMNDGLVLTRYWFDQITSFQSDPANFAEFYPGAAFAMPLSSVASTAKHLKFAPAAAAATTTATVQPVRAPGLLESGQEQLDAHHLDAAKALAQAALQRPEADHAAAYFLLGKVAASENHPGAAITNFQSALSHAAPEETHVRTWSNIYLGRLYDAENDRAQAVKHYRAALATADTEVSKGLAKEGVKAPFRPPAAAAPRSGKVPASR